MALLVRIIQLIVDLFYNVPNMSALLAEGHPAMPEQSTAGMLKQAV